MVRISLQIKEVPALERTRVGSVTFFHNYCSIHWAMDHFESEAIQLYYRHIYIQYWFQLF